MIYGLIAYKSNGANYCRGCLMESWGSDFEFYSTDNKHNLISNLQPLILSNMKNAERDEGGEYDFYLQFDGYTINANNYPTFDVPHDVYQEKYESLDSKYEEIAREILVTATTNALKMFNNEKEQKRLEEAERQRQTEERKKENDRLEYERLRKQFEDKE